MADNSELKARFDRLKRFEALKAYQNSLTQEEPKDFVDTAIDTAKGVGEKALKVAQYPAGHIRMAAAEVPMAAEYLLSKLPNRSGLPYQRKIKSFTAEDYQRVNRGEAPSTEEILANNYGVSPGQKMSEYFPSVFQNQNKPMTSQNFGESLKPEIGGPLDFTPRGAAGVAGDILLDPAHKVNFDKTLQTPYRLLRPESKFAKVALDPFGTALERTGEGLYGLKFRKSDREFMGTGERPSEVTMSQNMWGSGDSMYDQMRSYLNDLNNKQSELYSALNQKGGPLTAEQVDRALEPPRQLLAKLKARDNPAQAGLISALENDIKMYENSWKPRGPRIESEPRTYQYTEWQPLTPKEEVIKSKNVPAFKTVEDKVYDPTTGTYITTPREQSYWAKSYEKISPEAKMVQKEIPYNYPVIKEEEYPGVLPGNVGHAKTEAIQSAGADPYSEIRRSSPYQSVQKKFGEGFRNAVEESAGRVSPETLDELLKTHGRQSALLSSIPDVDKIANVEARQLPFTQADALALHLDPTFFAQKQATKLGMGTAGSTAGGLLLKRGAKYTAPVIKTPSIWRSLNLIDNQQENQ